MLACLAAIGLVLASDRQLRDRQNLVAAIAAKGVQQFIPMNELLSTRIERKSTYNRLYDQIATARTSPDHKAFIDTSYELAKFISSELGTGDRRRCKLMLDVVATAGDLPSSSNAYWALLEPAWKKQLQPQYPAYASALTKFAAAERHSEGPILAHLARTLKDLGEPQLELETLRTLRKSLPLSVELEPALKRLANLLPEADPEREKLQADLLAFNQRREQLVASMKWYTDFYPKAANATLSELEVMRQTAPAGELNAFIASADVYLAVAYAKGGRFDEANKIRIAMARYDLADVADCTALATQESEAMDPQSAKKKTPSVQQPNLLGIRLQAWRGHLLLGQFAEAEKLEGLIFDGELKGIKKFAEDEKSLAKGAFNKLSPAVTLKKRSDNLPAELAGASEALYGQFKLKPTLKTFPTTIQTSAEMWLTTDKCVVVVNADEPRSELPETIAKVRDANVWADECIELYFDPEHWFDMFYQINANTAGTVFDARIGNTGGITRRQYNKPDTSFNLPIATQTTKTDTGWQMRFVLPRAPLMPVADGAIRFNIRRFRHVSANRNSDLQQYSWTGVPGADHRPEQFGWLIIPK